MADYRPAELAGEPPEAEGAAGVHFPPGGRLLNDPLYRRIRRAWAVESLLLRAIAVLCMVLAVAALALAGARLTLKRLESTFEGRIYARVYALGVPLGGMSPEQAARVLERAAGAAEPASVTLRDGETAWSYSGADLGVRYDVDAAVAAAMLVGRGPGSWLAHLSTWLRRQDVGPVWLVDEGVARPILTGLASRTAVAPREAALRLEGGKVVAQPGAAGRALDTEATLARLADAVRNHTGDVEVDLVFRALPPQVADARPALAQAELMLRSRLTLTAYDPVEDRTYSWPFDRAAIVNWLRVVPGDKGQGAVAQVDRASVRASLARLASGLGEGRGLRLEEATDQVLKALAGGGGNVHLYLTHPQRTHAVEPGEALDGIAARYGMPPTLVASANPGVDPAALRPGQTLAIPSIDVLLPHLPVPGKRIVVSLSEQRLRAYENGQLRWEWPCSTGAAATPTLPGTFQVVSQVKNAYDSAWRIWMPHFLSLYPPGSGREAGIHGLPVTSGGARLWGAYLGQPVSSGGIVLGSEEAEMLYQWAEPGVTVVVQ